jgi:hypothetical protein
MCTSILVNGNTALCAQQTLTLSGQLPSRCACRKVTGNILMMNDVAVREKSWQANPEGVNKDQAWSTAQRLLDYALALDI